MFNQLRRVFASKKSKKVRRTKLHSMEALEDRRVLATFVVTDVSDAGPGTLRRAIERTDANPGHDTIEFHSSLDGATIQLTSGSLDVEDKLTIDASNLNSLTVDASLMDPTPEVADGLGQRVFDLGSEATINGLTIQGGETTGNGAGIRSYSDLTLINSIVQDNHALGSGSGVSVYLDGYGNRFELTGSTIANNGKIEQLESEGYYYNAFAEGAGVSVYMEYGSSVEIVDSAITGNGTDLEGLRLKGGGLSVSGRGHLSVWSSDISGNTATTGGGGVYARLHENSVGALNYSTVNNNQVASYSGPSGAEGGGGISANLSDYSRLQVFGSEVSGNSIQADFPGQYGGGINVRSRYSDVTIENSQVSGNEIVVEQNESNNYYYFYGQSSGGGVALDIHAGDARVVNSTISGNTAAGNGGGIAIQASGNYDYYSYYNHYTYQHYYYRYEYIGNVSIERSAIIDNAANPFERQEGNSPFEIRGGVSGGGGVWMTTDYLGNIQMTNSTVSGNHSSSDGGGILASGYEEGYSEIVSSTIANNTATLDGYFGRLGAGISAPVSIDLNSSIVSGNFVNFGFGQYLQDLYGSFDGSNNLIESRFGFSLYGSNNSTDTDPMLEPLADNGGQTPTHALSRGSVAIDAITVYSNSYGGSDVDQRGLPRNASGSPNGPAYMDIGAFEWQSTVDNETPLADAGSDFRGATFSSNRLFGEGSQSVDNDELSYFWEIVDGPGEAGEIFNADQENAFFTTDVVGTYEIQLTVSDGFDDSTDTVTITVEDNTPPIADASFSDTVAQVNLPIILDPSNSIDADGDTLEFNWSIVEQPVGSTFEFEFLSDDSRIARADTPGIYTVELEVSDEIHPPVTALLDIVVSDPENNSIPLADLSLSQGSGLTHSPILLDGSQSFDVDSDSLTFDWMVMGELDGRIATIDNDSAESTTLTVDTAGEYEVMLVVNDGEADSAVASMTVFVEENVAPNADVSASQSTGTVGIPVALDGLASSDPEEHELSYEWSIISQPAGSAFEIEDDTAAQTSFVADTSGNYRVQLVVNDGGLNSAPRTFIVDVADNQTPVTEVTGDTVATINFPAALSATGSVDPELQPLTFEWEVIEQPIGSQATINEPTAESTTWTADTIGRYRVQLTVSDGVTEQWAIFDVEMVANQLPNSDASFSQSSGIAGLPMVLDGTQSSDPEDMPLDMAWEVVDQPEGSNFTIDNVNAALTSWSADTAGVYTVQLTVFDGVNEATSTIEVEVRENATPIADVSLSENEGRTQIPIALNATRSADLESQDLTYNWSVISQPAGANVVIVDPAAATTTWTTDVSGAYRVQLIIGDGINESAPVTFITTVTNEVLIPVANVSLSQNMGAVNEALVLDASRSSDPADGDLSYEWTVVDGPVGSNTQIADPIAATTTWSTDIPGQYRIRLLVDNGTQASAPVFFLVNVATHFPVANVSLSWNAGEVGQPIALNASRSSDAADLPLTFEWSVISQPEGSNPDIFDPTAEVTTFSTDVEGSYRIRLVVNNGTEASQPVHFLMNITDPFTGN